MLMILGRRRYYHIFIHADTATGRRIKNKTSRRKVPVHPFFAEQVPAGGVVVQPRGR